MTIESTPRTTESTAPTGNRWFSLIQGLATSIAAFFLINLAAGLVLYSIFESATPNNDIEAISSLLLLASGFFTIALLLIPPILLSISRFMGWSLPGWFTSLRLPPLGALILAYPLILLGGYWLSTQAVAALLILPIFHIAAISIPILAILHLSLKGISEVSLQRRWGALSVGLTLSPLLIFIMEILATLLPFGLIALWVSLDSERFRQLNQLTRTLQQPLENPQAVLEILEPYLSDPSLILTFLFFAALVVPLIEEAIKPLGVWFLYGRTRGALGGFVTGALCGAGYALLESFLLGSSNTDWIVAVIGRSGTGAIHIFTSALVGSALTAAWQSNRYFRLFLAYLIAVFFHGVWNGSTILFALRSLSTAEQGFWLWPLTHNLATIAPLTILLLACLAIWGLWSFNRQFRKELSGRS